MRDTANYIDLIEYNKHLYKNNCSVIKMLGEPEKTDDSWSFFFVTAADMRTAVNPVM